MYLVCRCRRELNRSSTCLIYVSANENCIYFLHSLIFSLTLLIKHIDLRALKTVYASFKVIKDVKEKLM